MHLPWPTSPDARLAHLACLAPLAPLAPLGQAALLRVEGRAGLEARLKELGVRSIGARLRLVHAVGAA
jgi:hypothetical protein